MRTKFKIILSVVLAGFLFSSSKTSAQIPPPFIPTDSVEDPEFHSLRPYQASPANPTRHEDVREIYCGNDLIAIDTYEVTPADAVACEELEGIRRCYYSFEGNTIDVSIDLGDMELPIAGNTQLDPNASNLITNQAESRTQNVDALGPEYQLDNATKMNEYVSWYLNGTIYRAEWDGLNVNNPNDVHALINFSGPLKKLLPWRVQIGRRNEIGSDDRIHNDGRTGLIQRVGTENHNQFVGCMTVEPRGFPPVLTPVVVSCNEEGQNPNKFRLTDVPTPPLEEIFQERGWGDYWADYEEWRNNPLSSLFYNIPFSATEDRRGEFAVNLNANSQRVRAFMDPDIVVSNIQYAPDIPDSDFFHFPSGNVIDFQSDYHVLYMPHLQELAELTALLQETYLYFDSSGLSFPPNDTDFYDTDFCDLGNARWNSGDDMFGEYHENYLNDEVTELRTWINPLTGQTVSFDAVDDEAVTGTVGYDVSFQCDFPLSTADPRETSCYTGCMSTCVYPDSIPIIGGVPAYPDCDSYCVAVAQAECLNVVNTCRKDVYVALSAYTRTPQIRYIWDRTVAGQQSIYKHLYPRDLFDTEFHELLDLPTLTTAHYESSSNNAFVSSHRTLAGNPGNSRPGSQADVYIPHLGGIYEYFLKGIQKALRPQEFSEGQPTPRRRPQEMQLARIADLYNIDPRILEAIDLIEGGSVCDPGSCTIPWSTGNLRTNACGEMQITYSAYLRTTSFDERQVGSPDPCLLPDAWELAARLLHVNKYGSWILPESPLMEGRSITWPEDRIPVGNYGGTIGCSAALTCEQGGYVDVGECRFGFGENYCTGIESIISSGGQIPPSVSSYAGYDRNHYRYCGQGCDPQCDPYVNPEDCYDPTCTTDPDNCNVLLQDPSDDYYTRSRP